MQDYHSFLAEILISEDVLKNRVRELGEEISHDYAGKKLLAICILRGGVMFLTDLIRHRAARRDRLHGRFILWGWGAQINWTGADNAGLDHKHRSPACFACRGYH